MAVRLTWLVVAVAAVAAALLAPSAAPAQYDPVANDEKVLEKAGLKNEPAPLLEFFRLRTLPNTEREKYRAYVKQLGSDVFREREEATAALVARGPVVIELLREVQGQGDLEMARRAERCIQRIQEKDVGYEVLAAATRTLARKKADGAVEGMLAYLPFADNELVLDEARNLLAELALTEGKPHPALIKGLDDALPLRRAAAGEALARGGAAPERELVKKLLKDKDAVVRLRVGLALAHAKERDAVPVLIDVLAQLPLQQAWLAEDVLYRLADGLSPPSVSLGNDAAARAQARDAWHAWWEKAGPKVDLAKLSESQRLHGHTVVVLLDQGRVMELDAEKQVRWQINELRFPLDVQALPGDRILVAEYHGNRVTERDHAGKVLWEKDIAGPLMAQRLPNGHTFVATDSELVEFDRADKEVFRIQRSGDKIMKALKLPTGEIACLTSDARILRLDTAGKEIHAFSISLGTRLFGGRIHMLPNGRVLVPHNNENKVVEYDASGKQVWEVNVEQPVAAVRLPNGNTLVTSMLPQRGAVEFNPQGEEQWSYRASTRVTRAVRR
jgi:hypothetical protein